MRQIGIEFHEVPTYIKEYFTIIQELYKLGFVTIMWDENMYASRYLDTYDKKSTFFEIVFRRHNLG